MHLWQLRYRNWLASGVFIVFLRGFCDNRFFTSADLGVCKILTANIF